MLAYEEFDKLVTIISRIRDMSYTSDINFNSDEYLSAAFVLSWLRYHKNEICINHILDEEVNKIMEAHNGSN